MMFKNFKVKQSGRIRGEKCPFIQCACHGSRMRKILYEYDMVLRGFMFWYWIVWIWNGMRYQMQKFLLIVIGDDITTLKRGLTIIYWMIKDIRYSVVILLNSLEYYIGY